MKKYLLLLLFTLLIGCYGPANFSKDNRICKKVVRNTGVAIYTTEEITYNRLNIDEDLGATLHELATKGQFSAPQSFAQIGDIVGIRNNKIMVIKDYEYNE